MGTRLLQRSSRRVTLTDAGAVHIDACRRILDQIKEAEHTASDEYQSPKGDLRLPDFLSPRARGEPLPRQILLLDRPLRCGTDWSEYGWGYKTNNRRDPRGLPHFVLAGYRARHGRHEARRFEGTPPRGFEGTPQEMVIKGSSMPDQRAAKVATTGAWSELGWARRALGLVAIDES